MTLKPLEVKTSNIATKTVTNDKIADKAIDSRTIKEGAVTPDKMSITPASRPLTPGVESTEIKNGAVTPDKLSFAPVTRPINPPIGTDEIRNGAVTKEKLADGTIGTAEIIDGAVTTPKLGASSVTSAKIAAGAVKGSEIADGAVSAAKLSSDSVETAKIKDGAVTPAKASVGFGRYVPRACGALDFTLVNFTADGALHADGLDLSAIVPAGAIAVHLLIFGSCAAALGTSLFCSNQTDKLFNRRSINPAALGVSLSAHPILMLDADRRLDYNISPNITMLGVAVLGWFI